MGTSGLLITLDQRGVTAVEKQDFIRNLLYFPVFQNLLQLRKLLSAPDINSKRHLLMGRRFLHDKLHKRLHQRDRQIVYTVKPKVLQHFQGRRLSGS